MGCETVDGSANPALIVHYNERVIFDALALLALAAFPATLTKPCDTIDHTGLRED